MTNGAAGRTIRRMPLPAPSAVAELLKPITWFPPMWAFGCGVVASGQSLDGRLGLVAAEALPFTDPEFSDTPEATE